MPGPPFKFFLNIQWVSLWHFIQINLFVLSLFPLPACSPISLPFFLLDPFLSTHSLPSFCFYITYVPLPSAIPSTTSIKLLGLCYRLISAFMSSMCEYVCRDIYIQVYVFSYTIIYVKVWYISYISFWVQLISLNIMIFNSIHFPTNVKIPLLSRTEINSVMNAYHNFFNPFILFCWWTLLQITKNKATFPIYFT